MMDLEAEREHLAKAERDLVEGEDRVTRQAELVERLRGRGRDAARAEALLATLRETLRAWQEHRDAILRTIARLEGTTTEPVPTISGPP